MLGIVECALNDIKNMVLAIN